MRLRASTYSALLASHAKWDRGVKNLDALEERAGEVAERDPYGIDIEFDRKTGWHTAYARIRELPPPDLSVLIGGAAYQFLSALNLVVWELAERKIGRHKINEGRIANDIAVPIARKPEDFESLRLVTQAYVSKPAIARLRGVQPYSGPDPAGIASHPLLALKPLADTDKHRILAGVFGLVKYEGIHFVWDESVARDPTFERLVPSDARFVYANAPLARVRFQVGNAKVKVDVNRQPSAEIQFSDGRRMYSAEVMRAIAGATRWAITYLTPLFPGEENPWGEPMPWPSVTVPTHHGSTSDASTPKGYA
jgi:hypothetical protein